MFHILYDVLKNVNKLLKIVPILNYCIYTSVARTRVDPDTKLHLRSRIRVDHPPSAEGGSMMSFDLPDTAKGRSTI